MDRGRADLPVRDEMDPYVDVRGLEGHIIDTPKAMAYPDCTVRSFINGHASGRLRRLYRLEHKGMIAFCDAQDIVPIMLVQRLDVRRIRTQAVFGDDALAVWVVLAQCDNQACGGMAFTIIVVRPIVLPDRFRHQGNHGTPVGMDERGAHHLRRIGDRTVAMHRVHTRGTVNGRGGTIPRAIEGSEVVAIKKHHLFQRLATLEWPKDALEHRAEPLGGEGIKSLAHVGVARDTLNPLDGVPIALSALLITRQERGRFERKHGKGRHERIGQGNVDTRTARGGDIGKAATDYVQECISREMLPYAWRHDGHGTPRHEHSTIVPVRGHSRINVYERPGHRTP